MSYWNRVTQNLIMRNSGPIRQDGGDLGTTTWSYIVGDDGVKTIEPIASFYLNPPPNSKCRWSTDYGRLPPNHIILSDNGSMDGMPPRQLADWNDSIIQSKVEQYRTRYWEDLKYLVRPNTFEDLYELFDSATLWHNGAYNLWKLVNALVTLAHNQFPYVLQDWKEYIEKVLHEVFRSVTGSGLVRQNDNIQILHNQHILTEWDRTVDPLVLLHHTTFPTGNLPLMNVQQHGLLRELLICEYIRLTGTKSPIPHYYSYPRPVGHTAPTLAPDFVDIQRQCASINSAIPTRLTHTVSQVTPSTPSGPKAKLESPMPFIVVGTNDHNGQLKTQPRDISTLPKNQATSVTVGQSPVLSSPSPAPLPSISEESGEVKCKSVTKQATSPLENKPPASKAVAPKITTKEATPPPDSPVRDRKDSNGSTDDLFFPDAPSDKLHVGRQRSVASAPDQDTESMLSMAEKNALTISETPPIMQAHCDQGRQQSGSMAHKMQPVPQHGRHTEHSFPASSQTRPPFRPASGMLRGPVPFNQSPPNLHPNSNANFPSNPPSFHTGPNDFNPRCGPPPPANAAISLGPPMGVQTGASMGPSFQHQVPSHINQPLGSHGPLMNMSSHIMDRHNQYLPGYQANGYIHQPRHYSSQGEHGDNGYSNSGYRSSKDGGFNSQCNNSKRRDIIQSNGQRKNHMHPVPSAVSSMPRQPGVGFQGHRLSNTNRMDQNRGRPVFANCKNETGLTYDELFTVNFVECSCKRCQQSSRSIFVQLWLQDDNNNNNNKSDDDLQNAILKHFAQFNPINAKIKHSSRCTSCLVEFLNDVDIARIMHWSGDSQNQTLPGVIDRMQIRYPLFSKHYVPQQRLRPQSRYHQPSYSPFEHNRRDSNPFRNQQPMDTLVIDNGYNGPGTLQHSFPNQSCNDSLSAPSFPPPSDTLYQQVQPHNQPRVLYDPKASQRGELTQSKTFKSEQKLVTKIAYSQDARRNHRKPEGPWRQPQADSSTEEIVAEEDSNTVDAGNGPSGAPPTKNAKVSLPIREGSVLEIASHDTSRGDPPGLHAKTQDTIQAGKLWKEPLQSDGPPKDQQRKEKLGKNKSQKDKSKKERIPVDVSKITEKRDDTSVAISIVATPDIIKSNQRGNAPADELKTGEKSVASSSSNSIETTNIFQQERVSVGELKATVDDCQESIASSRTMTPETARPFEHDYNNQSTMKDNDVTEKQVGHLQTAAGFASPIETMGVATANNDAVTSGYSMTTNQIPSAVEDIGYSSETVIRHKPGRPDIPTQWANAEVSGETRRGTPSPPHGVQTETTLLKRLNDVDYEMAKHLQEIASITVEQLAREPMTKGIGQATNDSLSTNESTASSVASVPDKANTIDEGSVDYDTESTVAMQQKPKPSRNHGQRNNNKKKKKAQIAGSHLTSRPEAPNELQSRDSSPALDRPCSAALSSNTSSREPSTMMQDNEEVSSEGTAQPKKTNNKQAKKNRRRTLLVNAFSDGLAKSGGPRDDNKQGTLAGRSLQKIEASQGNSTENYAPLLAKPVEDHQALPSDSPGKSGNADFRSDTTGGSLRMPKNRSPKETSLKNTSWGSMKKQAPTVNEAPSLHSVFKPMKKDDEDVHSEASLSANQRLTINQSKKPTRPEMSPKAPNSPSTSKPAKNNDLKVALPKVTIPLPQMARSAKLSGNWASVAKGAVPHALQANKKDTNDPFAIDKEQVTLGDFIKDKNVKSPQKAQGNSEKDDVSRNKSSPTPSPKKKSRHSNTTTKSQLNAAVQSFDPSVFCTPSALSTKPRLNPNAATFSLPSSPSQSVASALAPDNSRTARNVTVINMKDLEKPVAEQSQMPLAGRNAIKKGHTKRPSLPGHTTGADKRFVTPAEKVLDAKKVMQPPPPSKFNKRAGPISDRSCGTGKGAGPIVNSRHNPTDGSVASLQPNQEAANVDAAEKNKDIKTAPKTAAQLTGDVSAGTQSTSPKTAPETSSDLEPTTLNIHSFPTLDQAAAVGLTKKRRSASIVKAGLHLAATVGPLSGTVVGRDIKGSSQTSSSNQPQKSGAKSKQTNDPSPPAPADEKAPQSNVVQKQTHDQGKEPRQPGDKDTWQTVPPKQNNSGGANKGHDGGAGQYGSLRSLRDRRGGRGGRDGATEERKGG